MIWLPLAAMTSIAPASSLENPPLTIVGMVMDPVSAMQLTVCPVTMPISELAAMQE